MTLHDITWITCHYMQNKMLMPQHLDNYISPTPGQLEEQTISYILVCTSMYWYVGVQHFTLWYVPVYTGMYQTAIIRTWYILVPIYTVSKSRWFFTLGASILGRYMEVYTSHVQNNTSWCFKCKIIHFLASSVRKMSLPKFVIECQTFEIVTSRYCN